MQRPLLPLFLLGAGLAAWSAQAQTAAPNHAGFPVSLANVGIVTYGKALVVDLDNNGGPQEIVVGTNTGRLYVFNHDGTLRPGWESGQTMPAEIASSPAAADLDGDGKLEIVVGSGSAVAGQQRGQVAAFRADGTVLWRFEGMHDDDPQNGLPDAVFSTPALGDLDGDGLPDVVFGAFDHRIYALKGTTGTVLPGWPYWVRDTVWSSPALADLDGDGKLEVIIGSDVHLEGPPYNTPTGGALWVFRRNGTYSPGFPKFISYAPGEPPVGIQASPVVGDVTGDGCPDIVVGTGQPRFDGPDVGRKLHVYQRDGTIPPGWPKDLVGQVTGSLALANLDADPALEIVATATKFVTVGGNVAPTEGWVYGLKGDGSQLFLLRPKTFTGVSADAIGEPIVAQVGTNNPAILVSYVGFDVTLISKTGAQLSEDGPPYEATKVYYTTGHPVAGPAVADLDHNGTLAIVAASGRVGDDPDDLGIFAWNAGAVGALPWPMFRGNPRRTGTAPGTTGCALPNPPQFFYTVTPCRVSDSRLPGNLTYGGPKLVAGEQRTITFANVCNLPATARTVSLNVTVVAPDAPGDLRLFPAGNGTPPTATINFSPGQTRSNNAVMPLSFDGRGNLTVQVDMPPGGQVHVILDVNGYFQ